VKRFVRSAARDDILRQFRYYLIEQKVPDVALRFLAAAEEAIRAVANDPGIGSPRLFPDAKLTGLRSWPVPGFEDIRVYYLEQADTVRIVRVLHGKRDVRRILRREDPSWE
jgi:toxin ParE1/3/4